MDSYKHTFGRESSRIICRFLHTIFFPPLFASSRYVCFATRQTGDAKKGEKMYFILRIEGTWENMRSLDSVRPECDDILTIFLSLIFARFALDTILFLAAEQHIILLLMQCWLLAFFGAAVLFMRNTNRKTKRATIGTNKQTNIACIENTCTSRQNLEPSPFRLICLAGIFFLLQSRQSDTAR